jgi:multidrug efflux pump subunit AcrA (membrane-fusion protein)
MIQILKNTKRGALLLAALSVFGVQASRADDTKSTSQPLITAFSKPSKELKLVFAAPGIVMDVPVKEGDSVTAGQILAKQDDGQDQQDLAKLKLDAASTSEIEYDKADQAVKQVEYQRKQDMAKNNVASAQEVEEAELQVDLDRAKIEVSELQHQIKGFDAEKQAIKVDRMQLRSPIDGKVQQINIHQGEMAAPDPSNREGAIVIVKNDPLWIEAPSMAPAQAQQLKVGQVLQVRYVGEKDFQPAKIIFIAPEANPGSNSQSVRLELPNPTGRDSGLQMEVKLPDNLAAVADSGNNP